MTEAERGRLLRRGRTIARVTLVLLTVALALHGLDLLLDGFSMPRWWQPIVCALLLSLLTSVVWPLVLRVALPLALFTLGIGSFLLLGAGAFAALAAVPGVEVDGLRTAVLVVLGISVVNALVSSLLAIDEDEIFFRRAVRRSRRSPEHLADQPPGVIFLQVDGLGYDVVRRAVRDGDMPTLARWLAADSHKLAKWQTDWSSQTGASVSGILHGSNYDILGFRWYEKDRDHVMACAHPRDAAEIERRHSDGRGLLAVDGASHGNLFTGDAPHYSLTMSAVSVLLPKGLRRRHKDRVGAGYYAYFANPVNAVHTLGSALMDVARELSAAAKQRRAGVRPRVKRGGLYPIARPGTTVIARDVVVSAVLEDMLAGRSVVYADFLGYDEVAHHSGIERFDSLAVLRAIDQQIGRLHRAAKLAPRRYHLVVLSDHGQTQGWAFADRFGESVEELVGRLCGGPTPEAEVASGGGPIAQRLRARARKAGRIEHRPTTDRTGPGEVTRVAPGVVVTVSGHIAMVSFTDHEGRVELETIEREYPELLPALVDHAGVGFMLVRSKEFGPVVLGRDGLHRLESGFVVGEDPMLRLGPHAAELIKRVDSFPHCADIMINSNYDPETDEASPFEPHVGSHGGFGGPQERGFLIHPREFEPPGDLVGAEALHKLFRLWLTKLGHPEPAAQAEEAIPQTQP
ncbi:phage holin family protein [Amycolatopsis acidiphila]|uniref:Phage holin family protein n=1 Tax=Amycolatopsis acidiphila TaxID=715473 RepID=A0A558AHA7_9PSEU|nr:phage holin family protein [Amycolatopsis acidiphila]TVT23636.1 phage holin family protein [Amycolatopsis acidiphila]UIJ58623.1 phage holin family protein [Amycolatopsis acidiphila]GHG76424.1 membrane protein [Amycolatopsis acidiphila]